MTLTPDDKLDLLFDAKLIPQGASAGFPSDLHVSTSWQRFTFILQVDLSICALLL